MIAKRLEQAIGTVAVETLLAGNQPRFFTALGELDWYSDSHRQWLDDLGLTGDAGVLEIGCATGSLTAYVESTGLRVTGLDRSEEMIKRARKLHPELDFRVDDATALSIDDDAFDAVVAASLVNVVADAASVLSEMYRVAVPGGIVSALVPCAEFTDEGLHALVESLDVKGFSQAALTKWHRAASRMSGPTLEALMRRVGLERVESRSYQGGMLVAVSGIA